MITPPVFKMPDVIPPGAVEAWRSSLTPPKGNVPPKVMEFIEGLAATLPLFRQFKKERYMISGDELLLCGQKKWANQDVVPWDLYEMNVPITKAIDARSTMIALFLRKGKSGLIDYVKVQLTGHSLQRILRHLHVEIFNEQDPTASRTFTEIMDQIVKEKQS